MDSEPRIREVFYKQSNNLKADDEDLKDKLNRLEDEVLD